MRGRSRERGDLRIEFGDFFRFFSTFDKLCVAVSLWNHQKWIPHEISHRYRSGEIKIAFLSTKTHVKLWKIIKWTSRSRQPPATYYYRDSHCKIWSRNGKFWSIFFSPETIAYPECSKWSKNWATYRLEPIDKNDRSNFLVCLLVLRFSIFPIYFFRIFQMPLPAGSCYYGVPIVTKHFREFWGGNRPIFSRQKLSHTQSAPNELKIELRVD